MRVLICLTIALTSGFSVQAQEVYENNLFNTQPSRLIFNSEEQMVSYLEKNKPSTFRYFQRLSFVQQKQVFKQHQANPQADITDIVVKAYRTSSRG